MKIRNIAFVLTSLVFVGAASASAQASTKPAMTPAATKAAPQSAVAKTAMPKTMAMPADTAKKAKKASTHMAKKMSAKPDSTHGAAVSATAKKKP